MHKIYCLAGMHRSGTSLMASYFERCGIKMGNELLEGKIGNMRGHYEDKEFLEFQKLLLKRNYSSTYIPKRKLSVNAELKKVANTLIYKRCQQFPVWGWKDPRSTLFLNLWAECSPDIRFVLLYRDPHEVVSSLCRRLRKFKSPIMYFMPWLGSIAWLRYNKSLLDFYEQRPERCLLVSINGFIKEPDVAVEKVGEWLQLDEKKEFSDVYHPEDMGESGKSKFLLIFERYQNAVVSLYIKRMLVLHGKLDRLADISSGG